MRKPTRYPWILLGNLEGNNAVGGICYRVKAGATLLIGDCVFIVAGAANTVNKSVTAANYDIQVGFVVAGARQNFNVYDDTDILNLIGQQASLVNEDVIVCIQGSCYGIAGAAIAAGDALSPSGAVAGRVLADATPTADEEVGRALEAQGAVAGAVKLLVGFSG